MLAKIAEDVKPATYYYNSESECGEDSSSPYQGEGAGGVIQNSGITSPRKGAWPPRGFTPDPSLIKEGRNIGCVKRLGLIAEEAPLEVLSADGKGVDLYKLSSFALAGVKVLAGQVNDVKIKVDSLEARVSALESSPPLGGVRGDLSGFQMALQTLGGESITLAPSSIAALVDNLYASVINGLRQMGLIVEQGIVRAQKLVADVLQVNKLVINAAPQTDASGQTKDATIGSGQVNVGELDTYIMNNQVSTTTKIFITPEQPVAIGVCETTADSRGIAVTRNGAATIQPQGFRVCLNATSSQIVKFNWWIVGTFADSGISPISPIGTPSATPTPTPEVTPSPTPTVSPVPSETPTPVPTETPLASPEPSAEAGVATETPTPEPIASPSPEPSVEPAPTPTP